MRKNMGEGEGMSIYGVYCTEGEVLGLGLAQVEIQYTMVTRWRECWWVSVGAGCGFGVGWLVMRCAVVIDMLLSACCRRAVGVLSSSPHYSHRAVPSTVVTSSSTKSQALNIRLRTSVSSNPDPRCSTAS